MRTSFAAALLLLAACATAPPLRPADPAQAVANERSAATAVASGVRIVARTDAWKGYRGDVEDYLTPIEVAIQNGSGRTLAVRSSSFSLLAPNGFRYDALSPQDVRRALGPFRGTAYAYGYSFYPYPPGGPFYYYPAAPWGGPWGGPWGWGYGPNPWWGVVPYYGSGYGGVPARALAQGTLDAGGNASVLVFFPVAATSLKALALEVSLVDTSGQKLGEVRLPFVRAGQHAVPIPLPNTAAPQQQPQPGAAPPQTWQTEPPPNAAPPPAEPPPVDTPVGPPLDAPEPPPGPQR